MTPNTKAALFKGAAEFDELLTAGVVDEPTKEIKMKKYTVLLLRPDYIADEFGKDTYLAHVEANSVGGAIAQAQLEAWTADDCPDESDCCDDYHALFCTEGHLSDLSAGYTT